MTKKIVLGALLIGLIGLLVWGGINRTLAKSESRVGDGNLAEVQRALRRDNSSTRESTLADDTLNGEQAAFPRNVDGQGQGWKKNSSGQGGQVGSQGGYAASGGNPQAEVAEWITLLGVVESVTDDTAVIAASTGEMITLEGRVWSFAQEAGFSMQPGENVSLAGFYEGDDFEIGYMEDLSNGQAIQLREQSGRPMWAGQGRGG